jgi:hypothetical protein
MTGWCPLEQKQLHLQRRSASSYITSQVGGLLFSLLQLEKKSRSIYCTFFRGIAQVRHLNKSDVKEVAFKSLEIISEQVHIFLSLKWLESLKTKTVSARTICNWIWGGSSGEGKK